jgi:signal transduction histidine kinase
VVGREVVETAAALVALLAAVLVVARYRSSSRLRDLVLVQALMVLAASNLLPSVLPGVAAAGPDADQLRARISLVGGLIGGVTFLLAAVAGRARVERRTMTPALATTLGLSAPVVGFVLLVALPISPGAHWSSRATHLVVGALYLAAGALFAVGHDPERDRLRPHLAIGCLVAATARITLAASPADLVTDHTTPADVLRLCFFFVLLAGAVDEIRNHWQQQAVLDERRRLARDLHDGVAQELAYIAVEAKRQQPKPEQLDRIAAAATRALDESRRAINALTRPLDLPLEEAVAEAATEVALRAGMVLRLDLQCGVAVQSKARDELVRIVREALTNSANHSGATAVRVELRRTAEVLTLRVIDDGIGFDERATAPRGRLGLVSMRERAANVGAELLLSSVLGTGTEVEVRLPCPA